MSNVEGSEPDTSKPKVAKRVRADLDSSEVSIRPLAKRARGKQGQLKGLTNMPIEVFTEIAKYMYPLDLVLLSRTNKLFRQLLMHRSATQTWRYTLGNVPGLPPCPPELCEPQYAALVFSKNCSMCGKQVLCLMNPALLVRLCVSCRDEQATFPEEDELDMVPTSRTLLPQTENRNGALCCLRMDLEAYRSELDAVRRADGDEGALCWMQERRLQVRTQWKNVQPLSIFIHKMEEQQNNNLAIRRAHRQEEIQTRLLELGWEEEDFKMPHKLATKKWKSLVYIAKPLTERDWDKILPQLTALREEKQKLQLEEEALARKDTRRSHVLRWLSETLQKLEPYSWMLDAKSISQAQARLYLATKYTEQSKRESRRLNAPYPSADQIVDWEPFQLLVGTDASMEDFEQVLADMGPALNTIILEWRTKLVGKLIKCQSVEDDTGGEGFQRLLRADSVFNCVGTGTFLFYPDDFTDFPFDVPVIKTAPHRPAVKITKALLVALGVPDATYLQMKSVGPAFSCGRCPSRNCVTWYDLVLHYLSQRHDWVRVQEDRAFMRLKTKYIFTHDVEEVQDGKPLVRVASVEDMKTPHRPGSGPFSCLICARIANVTREPEDLAGVIYHVQNV
ncbi:hypothetical protein FRC12_023475 [Ceratobasidium sp. 428]|nr:hypothetical protein FRC12_023475 [Ceratobasidium sp. 428]